jgi:DNA-binding GntR family transcriptional regulator
MTRAADKLIIQITQEIASGALRPGDRLEEEVLAQRFGVSRTPIREAIRSMVGRGLLEAKPRKGAIIRTLTSKEVLDLFEVAAELESMACRLATSSLTEANAQRIQACVKQCHDMAQANDRAKYSIANLDFHASIQAACSNQWLVDHLQHIGMHLNIYRSIPYDLRGRLKKSAQEHQAICDAILGGDGELASQLMRDHMMLQGQRLPAIIDFMEKNHRELVAS